VKWRRVNAFSARIAKMDAAMPLSEPDKQRIREEELYRLTDEHRQAQHEATRWKMTVFWTVVVAAAILLFALMQRGSA
jgi:anti-sigma-K factor RskA